MPQFGTTVRQISSMTLSFKQFSLDGQCPTVRRPPSSAEPFERKTQRTKQPENTHIEPSMQKLSRSDLLPDQASIATQKALNLIIAIPLTAKRWRRLVEECSSGLLSYQ
jgi:hypothetical protein